MNIQDESNNETSNLSSPTGGRGAVFITGGTGFIGSYIIKNLVEKGHSVRALRRSDKLPFFIPKSIFDKVEWIDGDVLDVVALGDAMHGADAVIHAAAIVSFHKGDRHQMYRVNIEGTTNLVNIALENNIRKFLHVSSVAALGRTTSGETVTEEKKWQDVKTNTHYAITKHQAEIQVWRGIEEGLNGVIINPSTVLGFGDWHQSSCAIFKNVYNEFPWYTKGVNGFVGVEDVAEAAVRLLFSDINEQRFIINADNWSFETVFNTIAEGFHRKPPRKEATKFMGSVAWRLEKIKSMLSGKKPLLTKETAKIAHTKTYFNNQALLQVLPGFEFTPLDEVIRKSCEKYIMAIQKGETHP